MIARSGFIKERDSGGSALASQESRSARRSCWNGVRSDPKNLDRSGDEARVLVRLGQPFVAQSIFLHLAVEGRPADSQASERSPTSVRDSVAARSGSSRPPGPRAFACRRPFQAVPKHVGVADLDAHDLALARRSRLGKGSAQAARARRSRRHGWRSGETRHRQSSPSASTTARNIAFSSWRTLPGQS